MKKSQLKSLIREAVSARLTTESTMGDIDIIAQESATFDEFVNNIKTDPDYKSVDVNDPEVKAFLQQMYDDAQGMNEDKFQFRGLRDLPIVDFQRKQFDQLNAMYFAYLVMYANSKGVDGAKISPNDLHRKYGEEITAKLGLDASSKFAAIATALLKAGLLKEGVNEVSGFASGKQFINIKLQKYPKALAKVNELITMIGESKFTMEMAEWLFDFFNNASFERPVSESKRVQKLPIKETIRTAVRAMIKEVDDTNDRVAYKDKNNPNFIYIDIKYTTGMGGALTALGSTTMSGSARKKGAERAMVIAKDTADELEKSYQLDDIDVQDLNNGKVQIFAVSDEFNNIDPKTDSKLKAIVDKFKHNL